MPARAPERGLQDRRGPAAQERRRTRPWWSGVPPPQPALRTARATAAMRGRGDCRAAPVPRTRAAGRARSPPPCGSRRPTENCPCVPNRRSARSPTASRMARQKATDPVDVGQGRHVSAPDRVGPAGSNLTARVAVGRPASGGASAAMSGSTQKAGRGWAAPRRIEVGIGANPVVHPPADQRPDGRPAVLAQDVPAGDLEPREGPHHGQVGALGEARRIGAAEHQLDVLGVLARHVAVEDIAR
jgi:hypothetical protein